MWQVLTGGALTLLGVTLGAWMEHRWTRQDFDDRLREERRARYLQLVSGLVADVRTKIELAFDLFPTFAKMTPEGMTEFVNTDSGKEAQLREQRIHRAVVDLGFMVGDQPLRTALHDLEICLRDWPEKAMGPVVRGGQAPIEAVLEGYQHVKATRSALGPVQREATALLAVQIAPVARTNWARALLQRVRRA